MSNCSNQCLISCAVFWIFENFFLFSFVTATMSSNCLSSHLLVLIQIGHMEIGVLQTQVLSPLNMRFCSTSGESMETKTTKFPCFLMCDKKFRQSLITAFSTNQVSILVLLISLAMIKIELTINILAESNAE